MQVAVLYAGFTFAVCTFGVWLVVMLRQDHVHRQQLVAAAEEHTRAHRDATRAARYGPTATRSTVKVARAGAFCRVPGNVGYSKSGVRLVCQAEASGRPRWRRADLLRFAS